MNKSSNATTERIRKTLAKRYRAEKRFRLYGIVAILFGLLCVTTLFVDIIGKGHGAFRQTYIQLSVDYEADILGIGDIDDAQQLALANFAGVVKKSLRTRFTDVSGRKEKRQLYRLVSNSAEYDLSDRLRADHNLLGQAEKIWVLADDDIDTYFKSLNSSDGPFIGRTNEKQQQWIQSLIDAGQIELRFNSKIFTSGDSREPEQAGIGGAVVG
ncbi:MAG: phosphate ABC transporter, permease protein PstA, partial [Gammaproteobacteria bacterium]